MTAKIRTFRYVRHDDVSEYLKLGWVTPDPMRPHPHMDRYRVIMEWPFDRVPAEPMGQFEAGALLRDQRWDRGEIPPFRSVADLVNRIADKMVSEMKYGLAAKDTAKDAPQTLSSSVSDLEYEQAAEDEQRQHDAADGFDE